MAGLRSPSAKASYFLAAQFNEYKLFFGHGIAWLQFALLGHVDIRFLCAVGNGFVLLIAILLWKIFLPEHENLGQRIAFFIPVSWLLLQLQYVETLNWAMPALQNITVLAFALGTIYLLERETRQSFFGALICLILAIAASGNGLLLVPIGVIILLVGHHYSRTVGWIAVSAACVTAYAYHYVVPSLHAHIHHSFFSTDVGSRPIY